MTVLISGMCGQKSSQSLTALSDCTPLLRAASHTTSHPTFFCDLCHLKGALSASAQFVIELGCYEAKREESEKKNKRQLAGVEPRTSLA